MPFRGTIVYIERETKEYQIRITSFYLLGYTCNQVPLRDKKKLVSLYTHAWQLEQLSRMRILLHPLSRHDLVRRFPLKTEQLYI